MKTPRATKLSVEHPGQCGGEAAVAPAVLEHFVAVAVVVVADVAVEVGEDHSVRTDAEVEDTAGADVVHIVGMEVGTATQTTVLVRNPMIVVFSHRPLADPMFVGGAD